MALNESLNESLRNIISCNEYINTLGIELLEVDIGYAKGKMKVSQKLCNPYGSLHGGALFSLADVISGIAAYTYGNYVSTISGNMNYISPAMNTKNVYCIANVVRQGKKVSVYDVKIINDNEEILETGSFTFYTLKEKIR